MSTAQPSRVFASKSLVCHGLLRSRTISTLTGNADIDNAAALYPILVGDFLRGGGIEPQKFFKIITTLSEDYFPSKVDPGREERGFEAVLMYTACDGYTLKALLHGQASYDRYGALEMLLRKIEEEIRRHGKLIL